MSGPADLSGFKFKSSFNTSLCVNAMSPSCCLTDLSDTFGKFTISSIVNTLLKKWLNAFALFKFSVIIVRLSSYAWSLDQAKTLTPGSRED